MRLSYFVFVSCITQAWVATAYHYQAPIKHDHKVSLTMNWHMEPDGSAIVQDERRPCCSNMNPNPPYWAGEKCSSGPRRTPYGCSMEGCYGARTVTVTATTTVTVHSRPTSSSVCASPSETAALRRIWNPVWQDHFYTTDSREATYSGSNSETTEEASPGSIFLTQVSGTVPLSRCYWTIDGKYDHFYTADEAEFRSVKARGCTEYPDRANVGYLYPTTRWGTIALYRLFNHQWKDHLYTSDLVERDRLLSSGTYEDEGVTGYILPH